MKFLLLILTVNLAVIASDRSKNYGNYYINGPRRSVQNESAVQSGNTQENLPKSENEEFSAEKYSYLLGFDASTATLGLFGTPNIVVGFWNQNLGVEVLGGFNRADATTTTTASETSDILANTSEILTTATGTKSNSIVTMGVVVKTKLYQNSWVQIYAGGILGLNYFSTADYANPSGTIRETFPALSNKTNKTVVETNWGTVKSERDPQWILGPKIGAEFYLKWIPHLALGFATGVATYFGGDTKTTTVKRSRTYTVVNGVDQPVTADSASTEVSQLSPGVRGVTFGLGGSTFQFNGIFTLRYIW